MSAPRVVEALNTALHSLLAEGDDVFFLGEDISDPYGGAFKVSAGLSSRFPSRVVSTPLSENGLVGVANGLAMMGHRVVVEMMFGDFVGLAFDQIVNMSAKSVAMYGERRPVPVLIRCPVGGRRGYGPTHSQSLQKHFVGVPDLSLYELSPFHDPADLMAQALAGGPALLFEDKVLYGERVFPGAPGDEGVELRRHGDWAELRRPGAEGGRPVALIVPGGVARRALQAMLQLERQGVDVHLLVPGRLHPLDIEPVVGVLSACGSVVVAEESTAGGTWGAEVAHQVHTRLWHALTEPVRIVSSVSSVIPAARHLESRVLVQTETLVRELAAVALREPARPEIPAPVPASGGEEAAAPGDHVMCMPRLNANDDAYVLAAWLVPHGSPVSAGQPLVEVETSKSIDEVVAEATGVVHHAVAEGASCEPGTAIATITRPGATPADAVSAVTEPDPGPGSSSPSSATPPIARRVALSPGQVEVARVVTASHREIPTAFIVVRVRVDDALVAADELSRRTGAEIGLPEMTIAAVGRLHADFPHVFGRLVEPGVIDLRDRPAVAITVDVGTGLFLPVVRDAGDRTIDEIADDLAAIRMRALRGRLDSADLEGATIALSLNTDPGVVLVRPMVPPGLGAIVSLPAAQDQLEPDGHGGVRQCRHVDVGLAHDHRFVNGAAASSFLGALRDLLEEPSWLLSGMATRPTSEQEQM